MDNSRGASNQTRATPRASLLDQLAQYLGSIEVSHPLRVAVDGITASGKSTFADEVSTAVRGLGRPTIRISMDGFHHPRAHRHRADPAVGYYLDAYDLAALRTLVLDSLGPDGDGTYRSAIIDLATDQPIDNAPVKASPDAIVVIDGTFLQRPELADAWDVVIFVDTGFDVARDRGIQRDAKAFGGSLAATKAYELRYHAACRLYLHDIDPRSHADVVVQNDDLDAPILHRPGSGAT